MPCRSLLALGLVTYLTMNQLNAQSAPNVVSGDYYLTGVREVGSGIKLNSDNTFEFFFSYGALDRFGQGTWKRQDNRIVLNSRLRPPKDFALVSSRKEPGDGIIIRIVDPNKQLLQYVTCAVKNGQDVRQGMTNSHGEVRFAKKMIEAVSLRFELCPDRYSMFTIADKAHNYFEFRFEPWIAEVFFENVSYTLVDNHLEGPHPVLEPGKTYQFVRE